MKNMVAYNEMYRQNSMGTSHINELQLIMQFIKGIFLYLVNTSLVMAIVTLKW